MLWKLYLGFVGFLVGSSLLLLTIPQDPRPIYPWAEYIFVPISAVQVVGLFGYVYRRSLLGTRFWQIAFPVFLSNLIVALLVGGARFDADQGGVSVPAATVFMAILMLPLFLPLLIANYRYAFRSPALWKERSGEVTGA